MQLNICIMIISMKIIIFTQNTNKYKNINMNNFNLCKKLMCINN